jgi:hypothetical protein
MMRAADGWKAMVFPHTRSPPTLVVADESATEKKKCLSDANLTSSLVTRGWKETTDDACGRWLESHGDQRRLVNTMAKIRKVLEST